VGIAFVPTASAGLGVNPCSNPTTPVQRLVCNTLGYVGETIDYVEYVADETMDGAWNTAGETVEYVNENCTYWTGRDCITPIIAQIECDACDLLA
ncbi:MAG TPA: hypothetical protein VNZ52_02440, partial [Candidatus Thermoplasmatota archaeon]|nr:hypothetical protein [Candidatus Thermoplasmatota archaeon]